MRVRTRRRDVCPYLNLIFAAKLHNFNFEPYNFNAMEKIKVASVQMNALKDDLDHNIEVHLKYIGEAAANDCALILFPELSVTAHYGDAEAVKFGEPAGDGPIYKVMREQAAKHGMVIAYGFAEDAHGTWYNSQALVGPDGLIGVQRKIHASSDEYFYFRMGRSFETFDLGFCKAGCLICYDTNFSESWRVLALKNVEVVLTPHAARFGKGDKAGEVSQEALNERVARNVARFPGKHGIMAQENGVFAVHCNQAGFNGHSTHSGGACIIDPLGDLLTLSEPDPKDQILFAELDPQLRVKARANSNFTLKNRRPEVYRDLTEMI